MPPARPALVIGVLASCGLAVSLMQTLVVPLLPQFPRLLDASPTTVAWLVTATLVAGAVCAPVLGRLGDMYGKRRLLVAALATGRWEALETATDDRLHDELRASRERGWATLSGASVIGESKSESKCARATAARVARPDARTGVESTVARSPPPSGRRRCFDRSAAKESEA